MKKNKLTIGFTTILLLIISAVILINSGIASGRGIENLYSEKFTEAEALNRLAKDHPEFPARAEAVTVTTKFPGGAQGSMADVCYRTEIKQVQKGRFIVTLTKDWNTNVNGEDVFAFWKYELTADETTLMDSGNNEYLLNIVK